MNLKKLILKIRELTDSFVEYLPIFVILLGVLLLIARFLGNFQPVSIPAGFSPEDFGEYDPLR